ncbi:MAG: ABC transporter substrate-binding protein [Betaproteobacteria bacterium]|nr:ABC transporter substrate-binding protein [Betaproteobacteria bacterium]
MNRRRKLVIALGAGALAAPLGSFAQQQGKVWRVGFLSYRRVEISDSDFAYGPFRQGMRELGYVEGKNLVIEWRSAEGKTERLPALAAELVRMKVDLIVAAGTPAVAVAQKATTTIPIVMASILDPVGSGFVASLARPGGNITGLKNFFGDLGPKHLEMLRSMVPKLTRVAMLVNPNNAGMAAVRKNVPAAAQKIGVTILSFDAASPREIESAFSKMTQEKAGAVIVVSDSVFNTQLSQIADLAAKNRLPSIHAIREYAEAGGLMSYGNSLGEDYRRAATYVDKIFKGAKPGDIPVEQPTTLELAINMKTAKALGIKFPQSILVQATKVIE